MQFRPGYTLCKRIVSNIYQHTMFRVKCCRGFCPRQTGALPRTIEHEMQMQLSTGTEWLWFTEVKLSDGIENQTLWREWRVVVSVFHSNLNGAQFSISLYGKHYRISLTASHLTRFACYNLHIQNRGSNKTTPQSRTKKIPFVVRWFHAGTWTINSSPSQRQRNANIATELKRKILRRPRPW